LVVVAPRSDGQVAIAVHGIRGIIPLPDGPS
jgi:hypothetical protein